MSRFFRRRSSPALADGLILLVLTIGFYWKLTLSGQYTWLAGPDLAYQVLPWYQFQAGEWHAGRVPLWDPYQWAGQPLLAQAQPGAAYPLNWVLFLLPLREGWLRHSYLNWYFVLIHCQAAFFAYLLARDLQRSRAASIFAGAVFAFGGYMGTTDWPQMLNGAVWSPLVLLFLLRFARGYKPVASAALAGAFLGISLLSGHHQVPTFVAVACAGVLLWRLIASPQLRVQTALAALALVAMTILCGGLQTLPAIEYARHAVRWVGVQEPIGWGEKVPYSVHTQFSFPIVTVLGSLFAPIQVHASAFAGVVAVTLAVVAVWRSWAQSAVRIASVGAMLSLLFCFGNFTLFQGLLYSVMPWLDKARNPSMAIAVFHAFLIPLTAFGFDQVNSGTRAPRLPALLAISGGLVLLLQVILVLSGVVTATANDAFVLSAVVAIAAAIVLHAFWNQRITTGSLTLFLISAAIVELGAQPASTFKHLGDPAQTGILRTLAETHELSEFFRRQDPFNRVEYDASELPHNWCDWNGVECAGGYLASVTRNIRAIEPHAPDIREKLGVAWVAGKTPPRPDAPSYFEDRQARKAFRHVAAGPRLGTEPCSGHARVVSWTPVRQEIFADLPCAGKLIVAETWYPGWKARVDGEPAEVFEDHGALRAVSLKPGAHVIELRFRPWTVSLGAAMTLAGLLAAVAVGRFGR